MTDALKIALNQLQLHIDKNSAKTLLIFDNQWSLDRFKRNICEECNIELSEDYLKDKILITIEDMVFNNGLKGREFRYYRFMPL
jgi:hypothetical protein